MLKTIKQLLLGATIALTLIGGAQAGETLQRIIDFKTLKVGMSADQPPMTTLNRQGGVMGLDVDLARGLARAMRVQLDIKVLPFGDLLTALEKGEIDLGHVQYVNHSGAIGKGLFCRALHDDW